MKIRHNYGFIRQQSDMVYVGYFKYANEGLVDIVNHRPTHVSLSVL